MIKRMENLRAVVTVAVVLILKYAIKANLNLYKIACSRIWGQAFFCISK